MDVVCDACNSRGEFNSAFEPRGRFNGYAVVMCKSCKSGLFIKNPGLAMISKRAKTRVIDAGLWSKMTLEWDRNFPSG